MKKRFLFILVFLSFLLIIISCSDKKTTEPQTQTVATPVINPPGGTYTEILVVTITCATDGATIKYTTDGTEPGDSSLIYISPLTIESTTTLIAKAFKSGLNDSSNAIAVYIIPFIPNPFEWCLIPTGNYTYGQDNTLLNIPYNYEIMKYEVSNAQYIVYLQDAFESGDIWVSGSEVQGYYPGDQYCDAGNYQLYQLGIPYNYNYAQISYNNGEFILTAPSGFSVDDYLNHPVVNVTWFGSWHFAQYYGWQLPTEHEWDKAARGMTGYDYPWGNTIDGSRANYRNSGDPWDNGTTPVGFYNGQNYQGFQTTDSPSPYGVYDMAGNVWNWTVSWQSSTNSSRVVRGGSWSHHFSLLQSWTYSYYCPTRNLSYIGFRCSRTLD